MSLESVTFQSWGLFSFAVLLSGEQGPGRFFSSGQAEMRTGQTLWGVT